MTDLNKDPAHLKACLREMIHRLAYPGAESAIEIVQAGKIAQAILLLYEKVEALEKTRA